MTKEENKNEIVFKDGSKHILDDAGRNGILVFRDAIAEAPFDDKSDYSGDYSKSTVKALIEKWWEDNAPNELKAKYDAALLSAEEVFSQEELDAYYDGSGKKAPKSIQLPLFANDWRNKCKNLSRKKYGTWWWLRTQSPWHCRSAACVGPAGALSHYYASGSIALVPACYPKNSPLLNASGAFSAKGNEPETATFDFGETLHRLKKGKKVARLGWNGKGQFVYYIPADRYLAKTDIAKSIAAEDGKVDYRAYLALKTAQGDVATWVPSISDCLAEDWCEVE